jgi:F-type H+-transporting ATPase subunit epsilon
MSELPAKILLQIVTPERLVVQEDVEYVLLPGTEGYLGVLPGHTPLLTSLKIGEIQYRRQGLVRYLAVSWGFGEVLPDQVTVLADLAERPEEIDVAAARAASESALVSLKTPDANFVLQQAALEQALVRLQVASKAAPTGPTTH